VLPGAAPTAGAAQAPGYAPPTSRRVPQWTFLERLFPEVILADRGAAAAALGGARVSGLRRALLGAGIAAALVVAVAVGVSWTRNRALATRTETAARAVAALPVVSAPTGTIVFPSAEALRTLDGLRGVLDTLGRYDADGPPLSMRWGLWRGRALRDAGERVWLDGYRRQLHAVAWGTLVDSLRALPDAPRPTDDYGRSYADLKAYLITTAEPARSTPDFLAPVLLREWQRGQPLDADVTALARRQFEYYAAMLPRQNPFPQPADAALVRRSRDFLGRFAGAERIYQFMLAEASKAAPPAKVTDLAPAAAGVVSASEVPGAFTAAGWKFMDAAFKDSDRFFQGERWVVGDAGAAQAQDRDRTIAELRARYRADYVAQWRQYVRGLAVARPSGVKDAAAKLGVVGGAQSPLLAALALAARNTTIDSTMRAAFQPVQAVTPGEVVDKFVSPDNEPYVNALVSLQGTLEQVGNMPAPSDTASAQALAQAATQAQMSQVAPAKAAARQLAGKFAVDTAAAPIGPAVAAFLLAPIEGAEVALRAPAAVRPPTVRVAAKGGGAPPPAGAAANVGMKPAELAATLNERGRALCAMMTPMLAKFPFNPDAQAEATVAEVSAALAPGTGAVWALHQERLDGLLEKQGNQWVEKAGAPVGLSAGFVEFFNRAARSSAALFPAGSTEPRVALSARGVATDRIPEVVLEQGPQVARFGKSAPAAQLTWPAAGAREAKLAAVTNSRLTRDRERTVARGTGEWALFRLVAQAAKWEGGGGSYRAEWNSGSGPVVVEFSFPSGSPVLQRGWLGGMACSPQITK
jgi:type VI secretion system protein ImpL